MQPQPVVLKAGANGAAVATFDLPRQGVALVMLAER